MSPPGPAPPPELRAMQRLVRALVTAPLGVGPALEGRPGVDGWLAPWPDPGRTLGSTVRGDARLGARERLDVYAEGYFSRLHEVLRDDYPTVAWLCGESVFHDLVTAFLIAHPSRSPTLRDLGRPFADFLARHPVAELGRARWPGVEDVARLEWAFAEVFDAPDDALLDRSDLALLDPAHWAEMPLETAASFELLAFEWPAGEAVSARRGGRSAPERRDAPTRIAVWREDERAVFQSLDPGEADALDFVHAGGHDFGDVCEMAAGQGGDAGQAAARAAAWLARWIDAGFLARGPRR